MLSFLNSLDVLYTFGQSLSGLVTYQVFNSHISHMRYLTVLELRILKWVRRLCLQWVFERRISSLPLPAFRVCLHSLVCGSITLTSTFMITCSLTMTLMLPSYKDLCDYIGPIWIVQVNLKALKIFNLICEVSFAM